MQQKQKKFEAVDLKDIEAMRNWCLTILDFGKSELPEEIYVATRQIFNTAFDGRKPRDIRDIIAAAKEVGGALARSRQAELNELLRTKFGWTLRDESANDLKLVRRLIKKTELQSDDEYRLVQDQLDDQEKASRLTEAEATKIKKLLVAYQPK